MELSEILNQFYPLPNSSYQNLEYLFSEINFPKGHLLFHENKIEKDIYFIKKGIVRAYTQTPDSETTFWFGKEGEAVLSMRSYVFNEKGYETIELLEPCNFYKIKHADLQDIYDRDITVANWGRKFAEHELIKTEQRLISKLIGSAGERYLKLLQDHPELLQRVPLGYIASFLGITQVSLSRIRAAIR